MVLWHPRLRVHIAAQMAALAISPTHRSFLPLWTQEILSKAGQQGLFPQPVNLTTVSKTIRKPVLSMGYRKAEHVRKLHGFNALDGTAVAEWAASPRGVLKFRPHSVGIDRH